MLCKSRLLPGLKVLSIFFLILISWYSHAGSRRVHAGECHPDEDSWGTALSNNTVFSNNTGYELIDVYCNIPSDSSLHYFDITRLNVHGYNPEARPSYSKACYHNSITRTYACGTSKDWGSGYDGASNVDTSVWTSLRSSGYRYYSLPYLFTGLNGSTQILGYFLRD